MNKNNKVRKPSFFLWFFVGPIVRLFVRIKFRYKYKRTRIKKNSIILCAHKSYFDAVTIPVILWPNRVHVVSSTIWYRNKFLAKLFRALGIIPKNQFKNDPRSIMDMIYALKNGGRILLFSEGQMSVYGKASKLPEGLSKLICKMKPNIYFVRTDGEYLSSPRWNKDFKKGFIKNEIILSLDNSNTEDYTIDNVERIINEFYSSQDEFKFMEEHQEFKIKKKSIGKGLDKLITICPKCGAELSFEEDNNVLTCSKCGYKLEFEPNSYYFKDQTDYKHLGNLFDFETKCYISKYKDNINIEDDCFVYYYDDDYVRHDIGESKIKLTNEGFKIINNEKEIFVPIKQVINLVLIFNKGLEIPTEKYTYILDLKNPKRAILYWNYINLL